MPLITGSVFLAGALLSCLLPISLLISFATFFYRQARKMPKNAGAALSTPHGPEPPAAPSHPYSDQ
jgi:hypothetical protein